MKLIAYTVRMGETDALRAPLVVDMNADYLVFSDRPCDVAPYTCIQVPSGPDPRLEARRYKVLADHPALAGAVTLYHDASYQLTSDLDWIWKPLVKHDVAAMRHPRRFTIEQEAVAIARYGYVTPDTASAFVAEYRAAGFLENVLTCSGLLVRGIGPTVRRFNDLWWAEVLRWNGRDQGSVDFAAWKAGAAMRHVRGTIKNNTYARWRNVPLATVTA